MKKTKYLFLITMLFIVCDLQILAQITFEKRIEFELNNGYGNEKIYKSLSGYFVMESISEKEINGQFVVKYDLYDENLELKKTASVKIPEKMRYSETFANDTTIYKIYKNKHGAYLITSVQISDLKICVTKGNIPPKTRFEDMKVLGNSAWFYAEIKNEPFIYKIDLNDGKGKVIPVVSGAFNARKIRLENYQLLEKSKELLVFLSKKVQKRLYKMDVIRINEKGDVEKSFQLSGNNANLISSVSGYRISDHKVVYTGTYSKMVPGLSEGLFFSESIDDQTNFINYYNFLDLKDFLSYLPEKRQMKIEKKKKKREAEGKEFAINYSIASHDIMELPDGYLFLGEAYYPTFSSTPTSTYEIVNGVSTPVVTYTTVFDGYQYTHAVLAKFSLEGKLLWDVCFEMFPNYKPFTIEHFIAISEKNENSIGMVFTNWNNLVSKIVDYNGNIISDKKWNLIETGKESDKAKWTVANSDYWYKNYFLLYGAQKIKDQEDKSKRKVYFVNKVSY